MIDILNEVRGNEWSVVVLDEVWVRINDITCPGHEIQGSIIKY